MGVLNNYVRFKGDNPFGSQAKMLHHVDRLLLYKVTGDTKPIGMEVNLTDECNLSCAWCINANSRGHQKLPWEVLNRFFVQASNGGLRSITLSGGGEPTLHPDFERVALSAFHAVLDVGLMTNGTYPERLNQVISETCQWVRISLDTVDGELYAKWKGHDRVAQVLRNLDRLYRARVRVGVNCNVGMGHTPRVVQDLIRAVEDNCTYIQFRPVLPRYFMNEKPEINHEVWDYLQTAKTENINLSDDKLRDIVGQEFFPFRACEGHRFIPVLDANGDLCICMYHTKDKRFVLGNIRNLTFEEIWYSRRREEVCRFVENLCYREECQICCKPTEVNRLLDFIDHPDEMMDVNFI